MSAPRLQFTPEEMNTPKLKKPIQKVKEAEKAADIATARIPKKSVKAREVDPATGKVTAKLSFEQKKPPSKLVHEVKTAKNVLPGAVVSAVHREVRQNEDDNTGVEASQRLAENAGVGSHLVSSAAYSAKLRPYRKARAAESKLDRANISALYKKSELEQPSASLAAKWQQKQRIKKQYAAARAGRTSGNNAGGSRGHRNHSK